MACWYHQSLSQSLNQSPNLSIPPARLARGWIRLVGLLSVLLTQSIYAQTYYVGVLAPQGEAAAQSRWQPWLDDVNANLQDDTLVLVPLALENWQEQIKAEQFALVLGPQVQFIKMPTTGWRWLATLKRESRSEAPSVLKISEVSQADFKTEAQYRLYQELERELTQSSTVTQPSATEQIASALWVRADSDINQLRDVQGRKIVAVDPDAFGGYLLIAHLLQQNGVTPRDYDTQFVGYPIERVLSTLASGAVDAAIAPLCLMEEMSAQGKINQDQYRLIHPVATDSGCQSSTAVYPNWTLAATNQAPAALVEQVNQQLFGTQARAQTTRPLRWLPPESSASAERVLYDMQRHPAQQPLGVYIMDWVQSHRLWVSIIVLIVLVSFINYGWMSQLAWRRRQQLMSQNRLIRDYDEQLRQSERLAVMGEMSGAIAHEINQPLATIQNYAQGLLIRHQRVSNNAKAPDDKTAANTNMTETALQNIVNETERVAAIITNIRRWAKPVPTDETLIDIAATYRHCILFMGDKAANISFWFGSDYQQLTLPHLLLDQLFINVMMNAQQQGAAHIMVRCQAQMLDDKEWLAIKITDDAGGFDDARLTSAHHVGQSTKTDGLGLGLMICHRLCKSLGGMMMLDNVKVADEAAAMAPLTTQYQMRQRRGLNQKNQLLRTEQYYPFEHKIGAQVTLYLPLCLADKNAPYAKLTE